MKTYYIAELASFALLLLVCLVRVRHDGRRIAYYTFNLLLSVLLPLAGNLILAASGRPAVCMLGYVLYLAGTNGLFFHLINFSMVYCAFSYRKTRLSYAVTAILLADTALVVTNLFTHWMFDLERITLSSGEPYYTIASHPLHYVHLGLSAGCLLLVLGVFLLRLLRTSTFYVEKYLVLLVSLLLCGLWEAYSILSGTPLDQAIAGYVLVGFLICYFALIYKPWFTRNALRGRVVDNLSEAVVFFDRSLQPIYANRAAGAELGVTAEDPEACAALMETLIPGKRPEELEDFDANRTVRLGEQERTFHLRYRRIADHRGRNMGAFLGVLDLTEQKEKEDARSYASTHDVLTQLYNRELFAAIVNDRMRYGLDGTCRMVLTDINEFKIYNDIYGTDRGDALLTEIADELRRSMPPDTNYCRWGGDQFALYGRRDDLTDAWLEGLFTRLCEKGERGKSSVLLHFGVYDCTDEGVSVAGMVDRCRMAIDSVKEDYNTHIGVYDEKLRAERLWEQKLIRELPDALEQGQIIPYFQPQYDQNGTLQGAEVLVRWNHPTEGLLTPGRFIPQFERNGMIARLDRYMWECACRYLSKWDKEGRRKLHLSVNVSPKDFYFMDLYEEFLGLMRTYDLTPDRLHLEITESVVMQDAAANIAVIDRLREAGFVVEMDDFGSGYSSLNLLRDMPVDVLKVDMVFLGKTDQSQKAGTILRSIINLSRELGLLSIAEGVELKEQLEMLRRMGCDEFQGYYFARPMPAESFEETAA